MSLLTSFERDEDPAQPSSEQTADQVYLEQFVTHLQRRLDAVQGPKEFLNFLAYLEQCLMLADVEQSVSLLAIKQQALTRNQTEGLASTAEVERALAVGRQRGENVLIKHHR